MDSCVLKHHLILHSDLGYLLNVFSGRYINLNLFEFEHGDAFSRVISISHTSCKICMLNS